MAKPKYTTFECKTFAPADQGNPDERQAIAYAEIDGYPTGSTVESAVICRVWLMKEKYGIYPAYLVNWHQDGYRENEEVQGLIKEAKTNLVKYKDDLLERVFVKAYEKYKMKCMLDAGFTLSDLFKRLVPIMNRNPDTTLDEAFAIFEGEMFCNPASSVHWEPENTFRENEWENEEYMRDLLGAGTYIQSDYLLWQCRA